MCRRMMYVLLVLAFCLAPVAQGAKIMWISDNKGFGDIEPNTPGDQGWVDLLTLQGHKVIYKNQDEYVDGQQYWRTLDPNKTAELEAADLVIMSRNGDSGSYSTVADNEPNLWNAVTTPLISFSAHMSRSNKWGWLNSTGTTLGIDAKINVVDPAHAVFAGVVADANSQVEAYSAQWNMDWVTGATDAGNGTVLATRASDGLVSIATWEAGQEYYAGGAVASGARMLFIAGTGSKNAGDNYAPDGVYNLTADGELMFINAVNYMLNKNKQIVWVSFHGADDVPTADAADAGFTEAPDKDYTDLLKGAGYSVTRFITTSTPDVAVLEAADLVITGRSVNSGDYSNDGATTWNGVRAPMIITGGYPLRSSRMGFTTGTNMPDTTGDITLVVSDPNHPIFAGIALTDDTMENPFAGVVVYPTDGTTLARGISINDSPVNAEGTVLAMIAAPADPNDPNTPANGPIGGMVIGEWPAGAMLTHSGGAGTDALAGPRLVFLTGSREADGIDSETAGLYDLFEDGAQMFLNAVAYMLIEQPIVENGSFELPGTVKQNNWDGGTNGKGTFEDVPGWSSDVMAQDSGVETNWGATDGEWTGFMKGADPSIWQLTNLIMRADDVIELKVDAKDNWAATTLQLSMYIDVEGVRIVLATVDVELTSDMQEFTLTLAVQDQPLAAGMKLGIELDNVSAEGESWAGLDNVRVEIVE